MSERVRVLHIDDSAADRELIRDALMREVARFEVVQAVSRDDLQVRLDDGEYDIVLSDFNILGFDGFDGFDVIDLVRKKAPFLPVIIVTGTGSETIAVEAKKKGATDYVIKTDSHIRRLPHTIQNSLEKAQALSERKRTQEEIEKQQYYLAKAQELGRIGTWELDLKRNELFWTDENCRIFGFPAGSVVNYEVFLSAIHPDDREYVDREWKAALDGKPYDIEHRLVVGGVTRWVREKAEIEVDEEGVAVKAIGISQDITDRKAADEALENLNAELEERVLERTSDLQRRTRRFCSGQRGRLRHALCRQALRCISTPASQGRI